MSNLSARLFTLQKKLGIKKKDQIAEMLGCSRTMLYNYEQGDPLPPRDLLATLDGLEAKAGIEQMFTNRADPGEQGVRIIPVVGWAHAGAAENYEEIPKDWQDRIPSDCRDQKAFAVRLEGDSMEPDFHEGDVLILQPSEETYSGCLTVIKLADDGIIFRRVELRRDHVRLIPLNPQYTMEEIPKSEIVWAFPVWGMWRQIWKR